MARILSTGLALLYAALLPAGAQPRFPEWRGSTVLLPAEWSASPIVAVGAVINITPYGEQDAGRLPWPMSPSVRKLYWCQGEFRLTAIVKGELHLPPRKFLWASGLPGCRLYSDSPGPASQYNTLTWFLREEGEFLRPTYDAGTTHFFLRLFEKWDESRHISAREQLGVLLLKPTANSATLSEYARYFGDIADIACELLGPSECAKHVRALAALGNSSLREVACGFLKGQLGTNCGPLQ